jgi:hypothetical protein
MRSVCVLLVVGAVSAWADVPIQQLGFANGDDWEPAVAADGSYVYVLWPHFATSAGQPDSSGATCISNARSYMFLQVSSNSGTSFGSIVLPRCPVSGQQIDAQIVIGPNHRVYASYMDGNKANSTIQVIYSDDHGTTWSVPVNAASTNGGDKDILLVDSSGGVYVAYEHLGTNVVSYSPNVATTAFVQHGITIPTQAKAGTALAEGGGIDTHGNVYFTLGDVVNNGKGDTYLFIVSSANQFQTSTSTMIDRSFGEPQVTGAGWDYWGASIQMAIIPRAGMGTDRIVVAYNAGTAAGGAERIYTKYSDTNGATWNVAYDPSNFPNGMNLSLAPVGAWHGFPSLAATSAGVKVMWQDNRVRFPCTSSSTPGACGLFNNYLRGSADGATNWSAESKMQLLTNHSYQVTTPAPGGFFHPYGDYTWMCTDGLGNFQAIWGEGTSYVGPGTIYFAHGF